MRNKLTFIIFISFFFFANIATAQKLINSPYSRFNIGSLEAAGSFRSLAMGGTGTAMRDNSSIYFSNPSSYSSLDSNSFVFDFGIDYGRNFISEGALKYSSGDLNFHHLIMGFPLSKGWGLAIGVVPVSSGFYKITETVSSTDPTYDPGIGEYSISHAGDGGITKFFVGSGAQIGKNFSVGANLTLLSGQLTRTNQFIFNDYYTEFHNKGTEKLELIGINFDYGVQYAASLKNNFFLNIGASLTSGSNYKSKYDQLSMKYTAFSISDTITYVSDNNAKTFIPGTLRLGISFGKKYKFTTGIDFVTTKWSASKIPGSVNYAADSKSILFGAEYIPDKFSNYSFINRVEYRIGGHFEDNYLIINGEQIKEYGVSIGIGIPMRRTASKTNLFFDFTRKSGSLSNSFHNEGYLTMGISLNLYDSWFLKRKYD
jgi:hypothetical protein